jgi:L-lactate dehydrogenase
MKRRVGIIGMGWVGSSVAISSLQSGAADELLLNDVRADVAEGEAPWRTARPFIRPP